MSQAVSPYTQKLYSEAAEALRPSNPRSWVGRSISAINLSCKAHTEAVCQLARSVFHGAFSLVSQTSKESCSEALSQSSSAYGLWWETFKVALGGQVSGKILSASQKRRLPPSEDPLLHAHIDSPSRLSSPKIRAAAAPSLFGLPPYEENLLQIQAQRKMRAALAPSTPHLAAQDEDLVDLELELVKSETEKVFLLRSSVALELPQYGVSFDTGLTGKGKIPTLVSSWSLGKNRLLCPSFLSRTLEFEAPMQTPQTAELFAVFDPFHGSRAVDFLSQRFALSLSEKLSSFCKEGLSKAAIAASLKSTCASLHKEYLAYASHLNTHGDYPKELPRFETQGATGTVVLILGDTLWTASMGNSRALLFTQNKTTGLTEMEPISAPSSPDLDLLGDSAIPEARGWGFGPHAGGVSPEPYIACSSLQDPAVLLLGSQDLFNFATPQKVGGAVRLESMAISSSNPLQALEELALAITQSFFSGQQTIRALPSFLISALPKNHGPRPSQKSALNATMTDEELAALEKELDDISMPAETTSHTLEASFTLLSDSKENNAPSSETAGGASPASPSLSSSSQEKEDSQHSFVLVEEPDGSDFVTDLWGASDRWGKD